MAEQLVLASGLTSRIFRPSIVIGHSRTLVATSFTGIYGFMRSVVYFHMHMARPMGLDLRCQPLQLRVAPDACLNLIPVDRMARDIVTVSLASDLATTPRCIYHITNDQPLPLAKSIGVLLQLLGLKPPHFVLHRAGLSAAEQLLDDHLSFYAPYVGSHKVFSRQHTDALVGPGHGAWPLEGPEITRHIRWYLEMLQASVGKVKAGWEHAKLAVMV